MRASGVGRRWGGIMATTGNRSRCVGRAGRRRVVAAVGIRLGWQIGLTQWAGHAQCSESQQSSANGEGTLVRTENETPLLLAPRSPLTMSKFSTDSSSKCRSGGGGAWVLVERLLMPLEAQRKHFIARKTKDLRVQI